MAKNTNLHVARSAKNDEFYTQYEDIAREVKFYKGELKDKIVLCNCDDPVESNFTKYFILNFRELGLKKLICTFFDINGRQAYAFEYEGQDFNGDGIINERDIDYIRRYHAFQTPLVDDDGFVSEFEEDSNERGFYRSGDFRSKNCIMYLKMADVVITNPPFSLFREYVAQLIKYDKKFLIIGNRNAITFKEIFPLIRDNKLWLGNGFNGGNAYFSIPENANTDAYANGVYNPDTNLVKFRNCTWFTNIEHSKRHQLMTLYKKYSDSNYPKYDNYEAIECSKVDAIPCDYYGIIGVPITFLDKYCPEQFELIGITENADYLSKYYISGCEKYDRPYINGERKYSRLLIRRK